MKVYTIEQLNGYIERLFAEEEILHNICVQGEVSGISETAARQHSGKTIFFVLKDENCTLHCIYYDNGKTLYQPKNGEKVIITGTPQYSKKFGSLRFSALEIKPYGKGEMYERFLRLKEVLRAEGLFDAERKRAIPADLTEAAVITSQEGAVIHDIIVTVRRRNPFLNILIYPVKVQGIGADVEIIAALNKLNNYNKDTGAIIIARGGGSAEDLETFNSESLARAVAASCIPVISAVGHETDITLCDMAADLRVATPTAAAVAVAADIYKEIERVKAASRSLSRAFGNFFASKYASLLTAGKRMNAAAGNNLKTKQMFILNRAARIRQLSDSFFENKLNALTQNKIRLEKSNPLRLLESGYAKLFKNEPVYSIGQLKAGDNLDVYLKDGIAYTTVRDIKNQK